jgi:glycosyltransferase involved in cell wall biosynthesis
MRDSSQNSTPKISVVMPLYNVAPYVEEAIASIQNQTIHDIEIILVNDCSTDQTPQIIQKIAEQDPRVRILRTPEGGAYGCAEPKNVGLLACRAPYIAVMDGDDVSTPDRLEKQLAFLETHPEISLVGSAIRTMDEQGRFIGKVSDVAPTHTAILKTAHLHTPCVAWLARRELYEKLDCHRLIPAGEDHDFLLRALAGGFRLHNLPEPLYWVRVRKGNTSDSIGIKQYLLHYYLVGLYKERIAGGTDSFCPSGLAKATHASPLKTALYARSNLYLNRARSAQAKLGRYFWGALSLLISPWQARLFWNRMQYKHIYARERNRQEG